jgi:rhodanese-related sulfurtransferase
MLFGLFEPNVPTVSTEDVEQAITNKENVQILDVRTPGEYARKRIEGSINLPVDDVENRISDVIKNKNQKIYAYCLSGSRSAVAVDVMTKLGYTNIFSMKNGLLGWRVKKFPEVS